MRFLLEFHANEILVKGVIYTFIVLIPKQENSQKLFDFRPIFLVGCKYKLLSKVLTKRLKQVIDKAISEPQHTLVEGR